MWYFLKNSRHPKSEFHYVTKSRAKTVTVITVSENQNNETCLFFMGIPSAVGTSCDPSVFMALCGSACLVSKAIIIFQSDLLFFNFFFCTPQSFLNRSSKWITECLPSINCSRNTQIDFSSYLFLLLQFSRSALPSEHTVWKLAKKVSFSQVDNLEELLASLAQKCRKWD